MKKLSVLLLLLLSTCSLLWASTNRYRIMWRANPSTTMVIGWNQASGSNATVYYGTTDYGTNWSAYSNSKSVDHSVTYKGMNNRFARLTGLQPNTAYYFVLKDNDGTSNRFWFKTAPNVKTERLSFIAGGDSRNNRTPRQNANKLVAKLRPHGVMFGGDMTSSGTDSEWQNWFTDWQLTIGTDGRMIPVVAARGNHESSNSMIQNLFDVPSSNVYYALTFGGSLIRAYTLNTEISISGSQTTWLSNDLSSNSNVTWKMAQYHKPMRPHVASKSEGNNQYNNWASLFHNNNVKLAIECDAHTVKTTWPVKPSTGSGSDEGFIRDDNSGTVYAGEGCWGAPLRTNDDNKNWTRNSAKFNQFKWIFVDENKIEIRTVKVDNASQVGTVNDNNIFASPANLDVWNPSNGSVVTIYPTNGGGTPNDGTIDVSVASGNDDVEEHQNGSMYMNSSDIELVYDGSRGNQKIGLRFTGLNLPQGATIEKAYIQFTTDEANSGTTNLTIKAHDTDNAGAFTTAANNVSSRATTSAGVSWSPSAWNSVGASGTTERTPELKNIVQELVDRNGWSTSSAMAFILTGTGERTAEAFEGSAAQAAKLHIEYSTGSGGTAAATFEKRVNTGNDDAEQGESGAMYLTSSDLELVYDSYQSAGNQWVGMRFTNVTIPQGATVTNAYVQFATDEAASGATSLTVRADDTNNSGIFTTASSNISSRARTSASVSWSPAAWNTVGQASSAQRTPDIKNVVQEVINRSGWSSGNAMSIIINGTGKRTAESYDGSSSKAPLLHIEYEVNGARYTAVENLELSKGVADEIMIVYPNPVQDVLHIQTSAAIVSEVVVYDVSGNIIYTRSGNFSNELMIGVSSFPKGNYILTVMADGQMNSARFSKE